MYQRNNILTKAIRASEIVDSKIGVTASELALYITAIAYVESTFNPNAKNKNSTARGLTQVLINTQRWIEEKLNIPFQYAMYEASKYPKAPVTPYEEEDGLFDPDYSLLIGAYYLGYNFNRYNDWHKAIVAYHLGSYKSSSKDGQIYKDKVLKAFKNLQLGEPIKKSKDIRVPGRSIVANGQQFNYRTHY